MIAVMFLYGSNSLKISEQNIHRYFSVKFENQIKNHHISQKIYKLV